MTIHRLPLPFSFPTQRVHKFYLNGRKYHVGVDGVQALGLLLQIYAAASQGVDRNWLVRLRGKVRQMDGLDARALLSLVVQVTPDRTLRVLAIWLRGRLGGIAGTSTLAALREEPDIQTRKEVARALVRMSAWVEVAEMAKSDIHPRIRQIASVKSARPYRERLANFAKHADSVEIVPTHQPLFIAREVDLRLGQPPKSVWIIRTILERIHRLVTGHKIIQR